MAKTGKQYNEEYKKIALRFLKEAGILAQWNRYVHNNGYCSDFNGKQLTNKNWYDVEQIDRIFGRTLFTDFLRKNCGMRVRFGSVSELFRAYVRKNYPNEFIFRCYSSVDRKEVVEAIEEAGTFNIEEFQKYIRK